MRFVAHGRRAAWQGAGAIAVPESALPRLSLLLALLLLATPALARERLRDRVARRPAAPALMDPLPGTERIAITVDGATRHYLLHRPPHADGPRPLVLVFHGMGGQGARVERLSRFSAIGDQAGVIIAYPEGEEGTWRVLRDPRTEITFTRAVVADIAARTPVDQRRIFAAGISNGAMMSAALGCFAPDLVAGVGLVSGGYVSPCRNNPHVPAILFNGTADATLPIQGGRLMMPVRDFAAAWGSGAGCQASAEALPARPGARVERFACGGAEAVFWTIPGGAHVWPGEPGAPPVPDATQEIWRFFTAIR